MMRSRIKNVKSIHKTTKAMKLVASSMSREIAKQR
jgi:F0F1-type ATP synthase gamma subunit